MASFIDRTADAATTAAAAVIAARAAGHSPLQLSTGTEALQPSRAQATAAAEVVVLQG